MSSFIKEDASDAACDLGRDGGSLARCDIASSIQQRFPTGRAGGGSRLGDFYHCLGLQECIDSGCESSKNNQAPQNNGKDLSDVAAFALLIVNAQGAQV